MSLVLRYWRQGSFPFNLELLLSLELDEFIMLLFEVFLNCRLLPLHHFVSFFLLDLLILLISLLLILLFLFFTLIEVANLLLDLVFLGLLVLEGPGSSQLNPLQFLLLGLLLFVPVGTLGFYVPFVPLHGLFHAQSFHSTFF